MHIGPTKMHKRPSSIVGDRLNTCDDRRALGFLMDEPQFVFNPCQQNHIALHRC